MMKGTKGIALFCALITAGSMSVSAAPFDAAYYTAQNEDVVTAVGNDEAALRLHYYMIGVMEGRAGNAEDAARVDKSKIVSFEEFDAEYYAAQNEDVTAVYGTDKLPLYMHYVDYGAAEGRMPNEQAEAEQKAKAEASTKPSSPVTKRKHKSKKSKVKESHTLSYKSNDNGTHDVICSVAGCTEHTQAGVACSDFEYEYTGGVVKEHVKICCDCRYRETENCSIKYKQRNKVQYHDKYCEVCGNTAEEQCTVQYKKLSDTEYILHDKLCPVCNIQVKGNHDWSQKNGTCPLCDFECKHVYQKKGQDVSHWSNGVCGICKLTCSHKDGNNDNVCDTCGDTIL